MGKQIRNVENILRNEMEIASNWYKENLLIANYQKYQTMTISIDGSRLTIIQDLKILGVNMDDKFNFHKHITTVCRKNSQKVGVLLRLRRLIPTFAKLQLYKSTILPHLSYCHLVWHFCRTSNKRKLERIQERALRAMFNSNSLTYQGLLHKANLPSLYNRRLQDIAVLMYKVKNNLSPSHITELFSRPNKRY